MYKEPRPPVNVDVRQIVVLLVVAFTVALGVVIGTRLSSDAIAVLVGVVAGVAASLPTALLLLVVTRRRQAEAEDEPYDDPRHASRGAPPVIVVTPGNASQPWTYYGGGLGSQLPPADRPRRFRVMGLDEESDESMERPEPTASWYQ